MTEKFLNRDLLRIKNIFFYSGLFILGLLSTYGCIFLAYNRVGWAILILLLIVLYKINKVTSFFIFFHLIFLEHFIYNPKTESVDLFLINKIRITGEWIPKTIQMIDQLFSFYLIFILLIFFFERMNKGLDKLSRILISVIGLLALLIGAGYFVDLHGLMDIITNIFVYSRIFLVLLVIKLTFSRKEINNWFPYILFCFAVLQIILISVGWIPKIIFNFGRYSGDYIVGTTQTSTAFIYLIGISLIIFIFVKNTSRHRTPIIFSLIVLIFLAQSVAQTFALVFSIFVTYAVFARKRHELQRIAIILFCVFIGVTLYTKIPRIFPYLEDDFGYINRSLDNFRELGLRENPKIIGITSIINDHVNEGSGSVFLGFGAGKFAEKYGISEFLKLDKRFAGVGRTIYTPLNILVYDFGLLAFFVFLIASFVVFIELKRAYKKTGADYALAGIAIWIFILISYFIFPLADTVLVSLVAGIIIGYVFKMSELENEYTITKR